MKRIISLLLVVLPLLLAATSCTKDGEKESGGKPVTPVDPGEGDTPGGDQPGDDPSGGDAQGSFTGQTLRLCTYNIESPSENKKDNVGYWPNRRDSCARLVAKYDFDMMGTQEASKTMLNDLVQALPQYGWIGCDRTTTSSVNAIIFRKSRFRLLKSGHFYYSPTPDVDYTFDPDDPQKKDLNCIWGQFEDLVSGIRFYLFNTHFHAHSTTVMRDTLRCRDARLLKSRIRSIAGEDYVMCTGDFNAKEASRNHSSGAVAEASPGYTEILKGGLLRDVRYLAEKSENDGEASFMGFLKTGHSTTDGKLDHIFLGTQAAGRYRVLFYQVITDSYEMTHHGTVTEEGIAPGATFRSNCSDHRPVMIDIDFWKAAGE